MLRKGLDTDIDILESFGGFFEGSRGQLQVTTLLCKEFFHKGFFSIASFDIYERI